MALTLYVEPKKKEITEEVVLDGVEVETRVKNNTEVTTAKFKNQVILKAQGKVSEEEVVEYLKEHKSELKKFIEKYKATNEKRVQSIKNRNEKMKKIEERLIEEGMEEVVKKKLERKKSKKK